MAERPEYSVVNSDNGREDFDSYSWNQNVSSTDFPTIICELKGYYELTTNGCHERISTRNFTCANYSGMPYPFVTIVHLDHKMFVL